MEIEKKFLVNTIPTDLTKYNNFVITQGYISTSPVIRIRQKNEHYYLTCKSKGLLAREEFEIEITKEDYTNLSNKIDYNLIHKTRYLIPYKEYTIELDIFHNNLKPLILAEVEFKTIEDATQFTPPDWFGKEVTTDPYYQNNHLCKLKA